MIVLCNGMPRSASTWSFNVVVGLLRRSDPDADIFTGYADDLVAFLSAVPDGTEHVVVKCHSLDDVGRALVDEAEAKVVYTWRNIADAVVSSMLMFDYGFEHALSLIGQSLELYRFHRAAQNAVIMNYAEIMQRPQRCVTRVASHLGLDLKQEAIKEIAEEVSFENTRLRLRQLSDKRDQESLLFPEHIRDGSSGYGMEKLTAEQRKRVQNVADSFGLILAV